MRPLRILVVHNRYQHYGGEDTVVEAETCLLRAAGHEVLEHFVDNDEIVGAVAKAKTAALSIYNPTSRRELGARIRAARPDVVHVHNFFPRLSPSIFDACRDEGVASVMTLHNFRLGCANAFLFRDGRPCEDCLQGSPFQAVRHRCYRSSRLGSAAVASMIAFHQAAATWKTKVTRFIALTRFSRDKLVQAGVPAWRTVIKPNFIADPRITPNFVPSDEGAPGPAVFVGRLSVEKGVDVLVEAWRGVDHPLQIVGDGPERAALQDRAPPHVTFTGALDRKEVLDAMAGSGMIVVPSVWYENFPMTVVEALALGRPVLASGLGALNEIVTEGVEGLHFAPGDPDSLKQTAQALLSDPQRLIAIGRRARQRYERELSPDRNLEMLLDIYAGAISDVAGTAKSERVVQ